MQYISIFLHYRGVHDHDTDLVENKVNTMTKEHIKQAIANPTVAPRVVFSNLSQNVLADEDMGLGMGISSLPKPQVLFNVYLGFCKSYSSFFLILFNIVDFNKKILQSMAKTIQRGRQKLLNCPPIPKTWATMVIKLTFISN